MTIREEQMKEFERLSKQFINYLYEYGNPHTTIIITQRGAEHIVGVIGIPFETRD